MRELSSAEVKSVNGGALPAIIMVAKIAKWAAVGAAAGVGYIAGSKVVKALKESD